MPAHMCAPTAKKVGHTLTVSSSSDSLVHTLALKQSLALAPASAANLRPARCAGSVVPYIRLFYCYVRRAGLPAVICFQARTLFGLLALPCAVCRLILLGCTWHFRNGRAAPRRLLWERTGHRAYISSTTTGQQTRGVGWRRWRACCGCCCCSACWAAPRRTSSRPSSHSWRRT